jgi:hypothetical protein
MGISSWGRTYKKEESKSPFIAYYVNMRRRT